jgi:RNA polymerase sigma-70 factor (ECF subfamily)
VAPRLDPETLAAARRLDPAAVAAIYDAFADPIFRYVSFRIRSPEDAEDLTDQVFLKMIEALPAYDDRGLPFAAWLYRIARNLVVDRYRRSGREAVALSEGLEARGREADPFAAAAGNLDREAVRAALGSLTDEQRQVVVLRFIEGWDVHEVALAMGRKPGAIHALQHRALHAMQRALVRSGAVS